MRRHPGMNQMVDKAERVLHDTYNRCLGFPKWYVILSSTSDLVVPCKAPCIFRHAFTYLINVDLLRVAETELNERW